MLQSWDKSNLVMMHYPFYILLDLISVLVSISNVDALTNKSQWPNTMKVYFLFIKAHWGCLFISESLAWDYSESSHFSWFHIQDLRVPTWILCTWLANREERVWRSILEHLTVPASSKNIGNMSNRPRNQLVSRWWNQRQFEHQNKDTNGL